MAKVTVEAKGAVRVLTLDNPERRNAIDLELRDDLAAAVQVVRDDADARALVVSGAGKGFCAGADLPGLFGDEARTVSDTRDFLKRIYDSFLSITALPIPTIAAVHGAAVGAGLNLAMACDIRIASPTASLVLAVDDDPQAGALGMAERYADLDPQLARDVKSAVRLAARGDFDATLDFESWAQASSATKPAIRETVARYRKS
ncbi:MAG TPA: enoyl-CoA hydratase-related protein [Nocardioidaceae bacterium]|nr:enoyl-CoA hydratase-related protein [Nocardioidaceae bacterium]